jgi:dolichol kinase
MVSLSRFLSLKAYRTEESVLETVVSYRENLELDDLIDEVRTFIDRIEHFRISDHNWLKRMRSSGEELATRLSQLAAALSTGNATARKSIKILAEHLGAFTVKLTEHASMVDLHDSLNLLARSYEELLLELNKLRLAGAEALHRSRQLKPTNYVRNIFHISMGLMGALLYSFVLTRLQAVAILTAVFVLFGILEITRRLSSRWNDYLVDRVFGAFSRPSERYRINSSSFYVLALIVIVLFLPKLPVIAATLVLAFADPAASLIGKRWGRVTLFRDKTWVGSLAFFAAGTLAVVIYLFLAAPDLGPMRIIATSLIVGFSGALTELLSTRIDDNFSVPIICAVVGTLLLM